MKLLDSNTCCLSVLKTFPEVFKQLLIE